MQIFDPADENAPLGQPSDSMPPLPSAPPPSRVLLTRLSAIGDCILTIPLAVRIKQLWPNCHLTWIVDCAAAELLEPHPAVDQVVRIEKRWLARPSRWGSLRDELRDRNFDVVFDPQGLSKSALLGVLSAAKLRVGFDYSHAREVAPLLANCRVGRTARHMVDTYLELLGPWRESPRGSGRFDMPIYETAAQRVEQLLGELGWRSSTTGSGRGALADTNGQPWCALNVGAGWPSKRWPPERFGRIASDIFQRNGQRSLVLWAGESEQALAEQVVDHSAGAAELAPATSLCELLELIRRASLLVSSDTAALQMASAVGTTCVGLFGPTWADEVGPYGNRHVAIQSTVLPDHKRGMRRSSSASMTAIELSEVLHACCKLLTSAPQIPALKICRAA